MQSLNFSSNWNNKLSCKVFTTIRLSNRFNIGSVVDVKLKGKSLCSAKCTGKKKMKLSSINEYIAGIDTGYSADECKKVIRTMYSNKNIDWSKQPLYFYLFHKVEKKDYSNNSPKLELT